ncbi:hypothetical protein RFI_04689 [Reticulomyxa filosa]|uniref:Kelch motif family protein n=1 Tax=Reticulomyxa filosa TaxID=46433 RepID=X6P2S7_RETFI|nr:hypothetical protein RFI_04689 [Reticulomyxa filosa]|eukprot:ETO32428.1 hypothetical protein RFI_04689 [Reticulomyxa filosa]
MSNQASITSTPFQSLKDLPIPLTESQCILHKHEILICGSRLKNECYSYHTLKNEYKFICEYPSDITLSGHCVVELIDNNNNKNEITLLSFGGNKNIIRHTLVMKYVSVWSDDNKMDKSKKLKKSNYYNEWTPLINDYNNPIIIGRDEDDYVGVRAVIGGSNNNLLFITYPEHNISVFDVNIFQFIKHDTIPTLFSLVSCHCFVSKSEKGQEQEMMKTNKKQNKKRNYEMLLFCENVGLLIEYNEDNNIFQFHQLPVCDSIAILKQYAYVCINGVILFFGGLVDWFENDIVTGSVYKYLIHENIWTSFEHNLPIPLHNCFGILNRNNNDIHIIGGSNDEKSIVSTHIKTKVSEWRYASQLVIFLLTLFFVIKYKIYLYYIK